VESDLSIDEASAKDCKPPQAGKVKRNQKTVSVTNKINEKAAHIAMNGFL
jgi:hypothetical protein